MEPKIEITYVLRSGQSKSLSMLEHLLLASMDNYDIKSTDYELDLQTVMAPADQVMESRLVLLLSEKAWQRSITALDLLSIANKTDTILFVRDVGQPVTNAVCYRPNVSNDPAEEAARQYLARNYGEAQETIFEAPYAGYLKSKILKAFYALQGKDLSIFEFEDEPSSDSKPVVYTVDLTNEETKKQIKNSLGVRNSACDLTDVTVNPETSEVTYTIKSALWGEKEHKAVRDDLHAWPLIIKEED